MQRTKALPFLAALAVAGAASWVLASGPTPSPWFPGGCAGCTIDAGVINVGNIDAGYIQANVVDAGTLLAGTVNVGLLDAGNEIITGNLTVLGVSNIGFSGSIAQLDAGAVLALLVDAGTVNATNVNVTGTVTAGGVDAGSVVGVVGYFGTLWANFIDAGTQLLTGSGTALNVPNGGIVALQVDAGLGNFVTLNATTANAVTANAGFADAGNELVTGTLNVPGTGYVGTLNVTTENVTTSNVTNVNATNGNFALVDAGVVLITGTGGASGTPLNVLNGGATFGGNLLPNANNAYSLGSSTIKWHDSYIHGINFDLDAGTHVVIGSNLDLDFETDVPSGSASNGAYVFDTIFALSGASDELVTWKNNGTVEAEIDKGGDVSGNSFVANAISGGIAFESAVAGSRWVLDPSGYNYLAEDAGYLMIVADGGLGWVYVKGNENISLNLTVDAGITAFGVVTSKMTSGDAGFVTQYGGQIWLDPVGNAYIAEDGGTELMLVVADGGATQGIMLVTAGNAATIDIGLPSGGGNTVPTTVAILPAVNVTGNGSAFTVGNSVGESNDVLSTFYSTVNLDYNVTASGGAFNITSGVTSFVDSAPTTIKALTTLFNSTDLTVATLNNTYGYYTQNGIGPKQQGWYQTVTSADTALTAIGLPAPVLLNLTAGTANPAADTSYNEVKYTTSGVTGNSAGISGPFTTALPTRFPILYADVTMGASVATCRVIVGLPAASLDQVSTLAGANNINGCWFRYDTGLSDTDWMACSSDGTTASCTDTTLAVANNVTYVMEIDESQQGLATGQCTFYLRNGQYQTLKTTNITTSQYAADGGFWGIEASVTETGTNAESINIAKIGLIQK